MSDRLLRTSTPSRRARHLDQLMLPAVTLLLLLGAVFIVVAWSQATDLASTSRQQDQKRADRLAGSVSRIVDRDWQELNAWATKNADVLAPGREAQLVRALNRRVESDGSGATFAWLVVLRDGRVTGVGEAAPGRLVANGIADDLRQFGRGIAASDQQRVSDRLKFGDGYLYAVGVPFTTDDAGESETAGAVVSVLYVDKTLIGTLFRAQDASPLDAASLLDQRRRVLAGRAPVQRGVHVLGQVDATSWNVRFPRVTTKPLLPDWAYPGFAMLLAAFALAYVIGDLNRRRLLRIGEARAEQVHALYLLASNALHAQSIDEQAAELARSVIELVGVDGAIVQVGEGADAIMHQAGAALRGTATVHVPISGPHGVVGELVVGRARAQLDEEERWVVQTAATLIGAAMHTLVALETERAAAAELQRLDELRSNLLATVAHELLSPLTAVKGVLGLLSMQDDLGERGQEYVSVATERTDRLVALIRDLFDCSLLETGQLDIRPARQPALELLEAALGAQAAARPGELRLDATPNLMITVDPVRFDQLVNNLVTNAFRYGAPPVEVVVRPADGGVLVIVADEGPGIPQEQREEVFGRFWQGSTGHARTSQGAGLGLALVQGLVQIHGGDITVDSVHADGRGARFTAFFPDVVSGHAVANPVELDGTVPLT